MTRPLCGCGHELWQHDDDEGCCAYVGERNEPVTVCGCGAQIPDDE